jgi:hypothetical protein
MSKKITREQIAVSQLKLLRSKAEKNEYEFIFRGELLPEVADLIAEKGYNVKIFIEQKRLKSRAKFTRVKEKEIGTVLFQDNRKEKSIFYQGIPVFY